MQRERLAIAAIAAGGAIGAPARALVADAIHVAPASFPWATFITNVAGCLAIGVLAVALGDRALVRAFVVTGVLGAFTTFSTFTVETDLLARGGHVALALGYVVASVVAGLVAVVAGTRAARTLV